MSEANGLMRVAEVERLTALSRSSVYRRIKAGTFPAAVRIGSRAVGWRRAEVARWLADRPRAEGPAVIRHDTA